MEQKAKRIWGTLLAFVMTLMLVPAGFAAAEDVALPTVDVKPGLYRETKTVTLSTTTPGAKIYYTTDNKMPDDTSTEATGAITVDKTTNICAIAEVGGVKSDPVTFSYIIKGAEQPLMQFVAMSDIHIGDREKDAPRVKKMYDVIQSMFPNPAAIVHAGDQINDNSHIGQATRKADHEIVKDLLTQERTAHNMDSTEICLATGNHDAGAGAMQEYYPEEMFPTTGPGYYHKVIGGYDFLFMNTEIYSGDAGKAQRTWLQNKLLEITNNKTEMDKPIFVTMHKPIANTVMGGQQAAIDTYNEDLKDYPQVVTFAGHSHLDMNDERAIHQNNFTSLNTGSMSYIEIDRGGGYLMHTAAGTIVKYEIPVTQCYFVEVFADRVEFDRVAVNADKGDARTNGFIPAQPYNNAGVSIGERWTVDMTGDIKSKFQYTAAARKGSAPTFAGDASVSATLEGTTAQVTFSQVEDVQKIHHYEMSLLNSNGEEVKKVKVLPEHYFSPVPKTLTYPIENVPKLGQEYTVSVIGVDSFGNKSQPVVSDNTIVAPKLPGIMPTYLVNESFGTIPTDGTTHAIPAANCYGTPKGEAVVEAKDGAAALINKGTNGNFEMAMPLMPGNGDFATDPVPANSPTGDLMVEFDWQKGTQDSSEIQAYFRNAAGANTFVVRAYDGSYDFRFYKAGNKTETQFLTKSGYGAKNSTKVRLHFQNTGTKTYIKGIWLNGERVLNETKEFALDIGEGFKQIIFTHKTGGNLEDTCISVDNYKVWVPATALAAKLAGEPDGAIAFDDIKKNNTDAAEITTDLDLTTKKTTANELQIVGWKSSNENVIAIDGTVTRPGIGETDADVKLTPVLGVLDFEDEMEGDYATAEGTPIMVTVKTTDTGGGVLPENINGPGYYVNEDYNEKPTDPATHSIPMVGVWGNGTGDWGVEDGKLALIRTTVDTQFDLEVPLMPGHMDAVSGEPVADLVPKGKVYVEFEWQQGADETQSEVYFRSQNGNVCVLQATGGKIKLDKIALTSSARSEYATSASGLNLKTMNKVRVLLNNKDDGTSYIEGFWVNGTKVKTGAGQIKSVGDGLKGIIFSRTGTGSANGYHIVDVEYVKAWQPVADQVPAKAVATEGEIAFTDIKGTNAAADNVTTNLALDAVTETDNGLTVLGWKTDNEAAVKADGTVTRPAHGAGDATANLTPVLGLRNTEQEEGTDEIIKADGKTITVKVKEADEVTPTGPSIKYLVQEEFATLPTDADAATRPVPSTSAWGKDAEASEASCAVVNGELQLKLDKGIQKNTQINVPLMPGTVSAPQSMPRGENMIEFEWERGAKTSQLQIYIKGSAGHTMKMDCNGSNLLLYSSSNGSAFTKINTFGSLSFGKKYSKIRLKINTTGNTTNLEQLWVDGTPKLSENIKLFDAGTGLQQVIFAPGSGKAAVGDITCSINYLKTWQSAASQLAPYVQQPGAAITFGDIKGTNTASTAVTANLDFVTKTQTDNGLTVVGWKSSDSNVIGTDGTVTRPEHEDGDAAVTLTPLLGLADVTGEGENGFVTVNGANINVTVKAKDGSGPVAIGTEYYVNESFDAAPSDGTTQPMPTINKQTGNDAKVVYQNGALDYQYVSGVKDGCQLEIPLMPGNLGAESPAAPTVPRGETYIEFNWKMGTKSSQVLVGLCGKNVGDNNESRVFILNCMGNGKTVNLDKFDPSGERSTFKALTEQKFGTELQKVRFLIDTSENKTVLKHLWIAGTEIPEAAGLELMERGGLYKLRFASGASSSALGDGDTIAMIDSVKVWKPLVNTLKEKAAEPGAVVAFDAIKGTNSAANNVTANLDYESKKLTDNGLTIVGWKSNNTRVVTATGRVTRQKEDVDVILTPQLGVKDMEQETGSEYAAVDGTPITITVKGDPNGASLTDLQYIVKEDYDAMPSDGTTQSLPNISAWSGEGALSVADGAISMKHTSGNKNGYQLNLPLVPGTCAQDQEPQAGGMPRGKTYVEATWKLGAKAGTTQIYLSSGTNNIILLNIESGGTSARMEYWNESNTRTSGPSASGFNCKNDYVTFRFLLDTTGDKTYVEKIWIGDKELLSNRTQLFDAGAGFQKIIFAPSNTSASQGAGDVVVSVNQLKTWRAAADQIAEVSKGIVSFGDIKGTNAAADQVKTNLDFSKNEIKGFAVKEWKSNNTDVIAVDGTVTRPSITEEDVQVMLTPVLGIPDLEHEADGTYVYGDGAPLNVTVKKMEPAEAVALVKENLSFEDIKGVNTAANNVTDNLEFIAEKGGVQLVWSLQSMTPSTTTAKVDPKTGMVVRPQMSESDVTVVLRAALSCGGVNDTKDITFTLKKLNVTTQEYLEQLKNALSFADIAGENRAADQITANLNLIPSYKGAQVTWQSTQPQVVKADGTVIRPDYPQPQVEADVTATLSMDGAQPVSRTFHVIVLPTDAENLALGKSVKVSVAADGGTAAANLTDGDMDTTFRTKAGAKQYTVTIDLGQEQPMSNLSVHEVADENGLYAIEEYTIEVSQDGSKWATVLTGEAIGENSKLSFDPVIARYVRLNVKKKKTGVASELAEVAVRCQPTDAQRVKADIQNLVVNLPDTITGGSVTLPVKGVFGSEINWTFSPAGIVTLSGTPSAAGDTAEFNITRPASGQRVTFTATAKSNNAQDSKKYTPYISGTQSGGTSGGGSAGGAGGGSGSSGGGKTPNISLGGLGGGGTQNPGGGTGQPQQDGFRDMEQSQWAIPYVMKLYSNGVVQGDENGNFQPEKSVAREEFVKMLVLALGIPQEKTDVAFADMEDGAWYTAYIQAAVKAGIVSGTSDGSFGVGDAISREDMATMVYRAMQYLQRTPQESADAAAITDAQDVSSYAREAVEALVKSGVISGNENQQFQPKNQSTRAEAAKMLAMLMQ